MSGPLDGTGRTVGDLLVRRLRELGVRRVHGMALPGLDHVDVGDPDLAVLLADADGRLGDVDGRGRVGAALLAGPLLHLSSAPGGRSPMRTVASPEEVLDVLADARGVAVPGTTALHLDLDLGASVPADPLPTGRDDRVPVLTLDPSMASLQVLVVAGPGVARAGATDGLRSASRSAGAPVLASWGATGLERWDGPFHAGVAGLQARDLELGGVADADVVVATGLDPAEVSVADLGPVPVQDVPPTQLGALCQRWTRHAEPPAGRPSVRRALGGVLTRRYESTAVPVTAARAALHLSGALPDGGVVVVDPGTVGFWVARAFPASVPGALCVPATVEPGFAAAAALVAALEDRPCLAVTDAAGAAHPTTVALLELAAGLGLHVALQVWGDEGPVATTEDHVALLDRHLGGDGVQLDHVAVDLAVPDELVAVAGPVVAWAAVGGDRGNENAFP